MTGLLPLLGSCGINVRELRSRKVQALGALEVGSSEHYYICHAEDSVGSFKLRDGAVMSLSNHSDPRGTP